MPLLRPYSSESPNPFVIEDHGEHDGDPYYLDGDQALHLAHLLGWRYLGFDPYTDSREWIASHIASTSDGAIDEPTGTIVPFINIDHQTAFGVLHFHDDSFEDEPVEPVAPYLSRPDQSATEEHGESTPPGCACPTCKMARFEDSPLGTAVIRDYSYEPAWEFRGRGDYYLGVELETDSYRPSRISRGESVHSEFPGYVAAAMRVPYDFWTPKSDSSVSGPEFVSHPATLDYWRSIRPEIEQMFTMLLHAGYRSHDNDRCGMHVNISRGAFDDTRHLFRFLTLIHGDADWSMLMAQRTEDSMRWCSLEYAQNEPERSEMAERYWDGEEIEHSTALNCPDEGRGERFEFRLPRGTLRVDRFYKNLEWTVAMIEFTRSSTRRVSSCNPDRFMEWVRERPTEYPDLLAFLDERNLGKVAA